MVSISEIHGRSVTNRPSSNSRQFEQFGSAEFSNLCFLDHLVGGIYLEFLFRSLRIVVSLKIHHIYYKYFILFIPTYHRIDHTSNCKRSTYNRQNCCYEMVKRLPLKNKVWTRIRWTRTRTKWKTTVGQSRWPTWAMVGHEQDFLTKRVTRRHRTLSWT